MHSLTCMSVVVCVVRKLRPCNSYSRRRDRINSVLWRSYYKGGGVPRWVESGESAMQEGAHLLCHPKFRFATSLPSISAAHTVKFPPKGPLSFTTATRTGKVPLKVPSSPVWVA